MTQGRRVVIGIGNPDRGDDVAGREVVRKVLSAPMSDVVIRESDGEATDILDLIDGADSAWLVDGCASGAAPGTVHVFDVAVAPLPAARYGVSTHGFGLAEALELARALGKLPPVCFVYAIEGAEFAPGAPMGEAVARAVEDVAARIAAEVIDATARSSGPSSASRRACP